MIREPNTTKHCAYIKVETAHNRVVQPCGILQGSKHKHNTQQQLNKNKRLRQYVSTSTICHLQTNAPANSLFLGGLHDMYYQTSEQSYTNDGTSWG
jgi:hypothetical protein